MIELTDDQEMEMKEQWTLEARKVTLDTLMDFINHLLNDYRHTYGSIIHAMNAARLATFAAMNSSEQGGGGITGFQASFIGWHDVEEFMMGNVSLGARILYFHDLLFPQMASKFNTIPVGTWDRVREEAQKKLAEDVYAHPDVVAHWQSLVDGKVPFGLSLEEE